MGNLDGDDIDLDNLDTNEDILEAVTDPSQDQNENNEAVDVSDIFDVADDAQDDTEQPEPPEEDPVEKEKKGVQKRIDALVYEREKERREKAELQRQLEALSRYAAELNGENNALSQTLTGGQSAYVEDKKRFLDAELVNAKSVLQRAFDEGDMAAVAEANQRISALTVERAQVDSWQTVTPRKVQVPRELLEFAKQQQQQQQQPQAPKRYEVDERTKAWAEKNDWFGKDQEMTATATQMHNALVQMHGEDYALRDPDTYFATIDAAVSARFGDRLKKPRQQQRSAVAPVVRQGGGSGGGGNKVTLSAEERQAAKNFGMTIEQYARLKKAGG